MASLRQLLGRALDRGLARSRYPGLGMAARQPPPTPHWLQPPRLLLLLLLCALCHISVPALAALSQEGRAAAFIGYSEEDAGSKGAAAVEGEGAAAATADGAAGEGRGGGAELPCPADEHPECAAWAEQGECLGNPGFMRTACKASCKVVARCVRGMASAGGPWSGHATASGTASWAAHSMAARPAEGHFRLHPVRHSGVGSPPGGLTLSSLGVGTYLGGSDAATDEAVTNAIIKTVAGLRWNVIDTAANYRWGQAEVSVGAALGALRALGGAEREQLFISTKAGYPPEGLLERLLGEGAVSQADVADGTHCMHPAYLRASLDRSLAAMGLATVDLLYIHNPAESQLQLLGREAFMQRLRAAFQFCEEARAAGWIKAYGVATWSCFRVPPDSDEHLNLQSVVALAEQVGGADHGFRYIQLPISAGMPEAWSQPWQELRSSSSSSSSSLSGGGGGSGSSSSLSGGGGGSGTGGGSEAARVTLMRAAQELGVGVFGSGPLMEAGLLQDRGLAREVEALPQLQGIQGTAPRLLQLARSTPGLLTSLVGQKTPAHVEANGALTQVPPLSEAEFLVAAAKLGVS